MKAAAMIDTTLGQLVDAEPALKRLADRPFAPRVGYLLAKLLTAVKAETAAFHTERQRLAERLGTTRDATAEERPTMGPTVLEIPTHQFGAFADGVADLMAAPVGLAFAPFDLHNLGDVPISAADIALLGPLVTLNGTE